MLKYDEVVSRLNSTQNLTSRIQFLLIDSSVDHFEEITFLFEDRKVVLEELHLFFRENGMNYFTQREREIINDLIQEIINADSQNVSMIDNKVNEIQTSFKKLQKQKSLLIYSKSVL